VAKRDLLFALLLALAAAGASWFASARVPLPVYAHRYDIWFEGDMERVYDNMVDRHSDHYRSKVHPLFSLVAYGLTWLPRCALHLDPVISVRLVMAAAALVWAALLYTLLRTIAADSLGALLLGGGGVASASLLFWTAVPETYVFGSITILLALLVASRAPRMREPLLVAVSAATLAFTVTNWMAGMATALAALPWRRAVQVTINAFALVVVLWGVEKFLFPTAVFFIGDREEAGFVFRPTAERVADVANGFFVAPMVMPRFVPTFRDDHPEQLMLTQKSRFWRQDLLADGAAVVWLLLLLLGLLSLGAAPELRALKIALLLTLAGQFALHVVYGNETFLYSLHFLPLLLALAAFALRTRARKAALVLAALLLAGAAVNNIQRFREDVTFAAHPPLHAIPQR
jgi:hypothetical protein